MHLEFSGPFLESVYGNANLILASGPGNSKCLVGADAVAAPTCWARCLSRAARRSAKEAPDRDRASPTCGRTVHPQPRGVFGAGPG
jgi:hypothetical protein